MKIIIQDASVLIDMADCDLLDAWFGLGFDLRTTSMILREVTRKSQKVKLQRYLDNGQLGIEKTSGEQMSEIVALSRALSSRLTIEDVSALYVASKIGGVLLTGDKRLREQADARGI